MSVIGLIEESEETKFCAAMHGPIPFMRHRPQAKQKTALPYNLLTALVESGALAILRGVSDNNGQEV